MPSTNNVGGGISVHVTTSKSAVLIFKHHGVYSFFQRLSAIWGLVIMADRPPFWINIWISLFNKFPSTSKLLGVGLMVKLASLKGNPNTIYIYFYFLMKTIENHWSRSILNGKNFEFFVKSQCQKESESVDFRFR